MQRISTRTTLTREQREIYLARRAAEPSYRAYRAAATQMRTASKLARGDVRRGQMEITPPRLRETRLLRHWVPLDTAGAIAPPAGPRARALRAAPLAGMTPVISRSSALDYALDLHAGADAVTCHGADGARRQALWRGAVAVATFGVTLAVALAVGLWPLPLLAVVALLAPAFLGLAAMLTGAARPTPTANALRADAAQRLRELASHTQHKALWLRRKADLVAGLPAASPPVPVLPTSPPSPAPQAPFAPPLGLPRPSPASMRELMDVIIIGLAQVEAHLTRDS